ncbi:hypothetical protein BJX99DRAFT_266418 [Aspergillus californicus]
MTFLSSIALTLTLTLPITAQDARPMENLGRGVVAVRANDTHTLVTWRLLGLDPVDIGFNLYRYTDDSDDAEALNSEVLTADTGTNFFDSVSDFSQANTYFVRTVIDGEEDADASGAFTLPGDNAVEPAIRIPIRDSGPIKYVWVGDLDGDGEYDFVVDRINEQQSIEAYSRNGTFLWEVGLGANSENQNNIEPGSTAISVGNWDGVTVYDFDLDGIAEVAIRISNGVVFGDGEEFVHESDDEQFIAILDGRTGALKATSAVPTDFIEHGPLAARFGVGYLDGVRPHLVAFMKNRRDDKAFNRVMGAWTFDGSEVTEEWITMGDALTGADGHNTRILDVDGDGKDEVVEIGFVLDGDGSVLYQMPDVIVHGDRYYIGKMDPEREGLQGYGIQQDNEDLLMEYYYDAADGTLLWEHYGSEVGDVGRGLAGDIDPTRPGYEVWSFYGVYNAASNETTTDGDPELAPWPQMTLLWDGDVLQELYNDGKLEKWNWEEPSTSTSLPRIFRIETYGAQNPSNYNPGFLGDILGDWREEIVVTNGDYTELVIFTTDIPTDVRLYTLAHNPAYRNAMTVKGYMQSHMVDYYLGDGMSTPDQPNIQYVT